MYLKRYDDFINEEINLKKALVGAAIGGSMLLNSPALTQTNTKKEKDSVLVGRVDSPIVVDKIKIGAMSTDSIQLHYFALPQVGWGTQDTTGNTWKKLFPINKRLIHITHHSQTFSDVPLHGVLNYIKTEEIKVHFWKNRGSRSNIFGDKVLISFLLNNKEYSSKEDYFYIFDKNDFDSIGNLELNKTFKFKITQLLCYPKNIIELDKSLNDYLTCVTFYTPYATHEDQDMNFYIKIGYSEGRKIVRFNIVDPFYDNSDRLGMYERRAFDFDKLYYEVSYNEFIKLINK